MTLAANVGPPNGLGDHCRATRRSYPPLDIGRHICLSAPNKIMAATIMDQAATSGHHANLKKMYMSLAIFLEVLYVLFFEKCFLKSALFF